MTDDHERIKQWLDQQRTTHDDVADEIRRRQAEDPAAVAAIVAAIEARARAAQSGRWPDSVAGLAKVLRVSSASRVFVASARRDVLWLCRELRRRDALTTPHHTATVDHTRPSQEPQ